MNTKIINVAVIAHVDHGKTTLVDALLKQTHVFRENQSEMQDTQIMDSNDLEKERGITILAKNCSISYKDTKINIIDTPGHADFSGEVERTLGMANGALLIVDAQEGPMPQTKVVLKRALEMNLKIIVCINKIDKKHANPKETLAKIESLFLDLATNEEALDFPVVYTIGKLGTAYLEVPVNYEDKADIFPLLDTILNTVPPSNVRDGVFKMPVSSIDFESHLGKISIGRIYQGQIKAKDKVIVTNDINKIWTVDKVFVYEGLTRKEVNEAPCGEIVALSGIGQVAIGDTLSDPTDITSLPAVTIGEPTLAITMGPNTSPFAGREGKFTTGRQIEERLVKELESNLSLRVTKLANGKFAVSGRGELHLSILLETMRREGFEMEVSKPEVIIKEVDGQKQEPVEEVSIIVQNEYVGAVSEELGRRLATLIRMEPNANGEMFFLYSAPTRVLIGLRSVLTTASKGTLVYSSVIEGFKPLGRPLPKLRRGALIASQDGETLSYGLENAQQRGILFVGSGVKIYEGMIVGINSKNEDVMVNACKGKKLTNMRSKSSDGVIQLTPATVLSLEQSLDFLEDDELLEITPLSLRLRKKFLTDIERRRHQRKAN
ncbi:GTP-binding protein [Candidatus Woesebacteria bacterium]|nr:MAG: GTP-binding protein [Candidatus Woesebacteria bacterium]